MEKWQRIIILVALLFAGCTPAITPSQTKVTDVPTLLPTSLTAVATVPTGIPVLSTSTTEAVDSNGCFEALTKAPETTWGHGVVVLENRKYDSIGRGIPGFFLLSMETGQFHDLDNVNDRLGTAFVSPNGSLMSLEKITLDDQGTTKSDQLLIMNADGSIQKTLPWEEGAVSGAVWLDDQHVIINIAGLNPDENSGVKPSTLLVLNPFTGKRQILKPDLPGIYDVYPLPFFNDPWGYSLSVYNQALSYVVYLSEGGYTYILWDVKHKQEITRLLHWNISGPEVPRWSPDGSRFVMSAFSGDMSQWPQPANGLYTVDLEGNIRKLMNTSADVFILDHFWSPSGRYIALLKNVPNPAIQQKRLLILDTQTLQIVDTCVEYDSWMTYDTPIWSPDEAQILVYDNTQQHSEVRLVDLIKKTDFPIAEDMEPKGWMKSP